MDKIKYSPSQKRFYSESLSYPNLPDDLIVISSEQHAHALNALNSGGTVDVKKGKLIVNYPSQKEIDAAKAKANWVIYQADARSLLESSDQIVWRCYENKIEVPVDWIECRNALRMILRAEVGDCSISLPELPPKPFN